MEIIENGEDPDSSNSRAMKANQYTKVRNWGQMEGMLIPEIPEEKIS
jgi:hypothetical protein